MPNVLTLTEPDGSPVIADEGEWTQVTGRFEDLQSGTLDKASILTLRMTLYDEVTGDIINGRDNQNILDANGGSVAPDGTLTLNLSNLDNVIVTRNDRVEAHIVLTKWTWVDTTGATVEGLQLWRIRVAPLASGSIPSTPGLLPRPTRVRRPNRYLYANVVDHILLNENVPGTEPKAVARIERAVQNANGSWHTYNDGGFRCYDQVQRMVAGGVVDLNEATVDADGLVTTTGVELPDWLGYGHFKIDREWYPVIADLGTGFSFLVENVGLEPGTYESSLEQIYMPLPADFHRRGSVTEGRNRYPITDVDASTLQGWRDFYSWARNSASARVFGAITTDKRFQGSIGLALWPAFGEDTIVSLWYQRNPTPLIVQRESAGLVTAAGTRVTCDTPIFADVHKGSMIVFAADADDAIRTPGAPQNLAVDSRIITNINSTTECTVDADLTITTGVAYYISDIVDVLGRPMEEAFQRCAEWQLNQDMRSKYSRSSYDDFVEAIEKAMVHDNRSMDPRTGASQEWYGSAIGDVDARPY